MKFIADLHIHTTFSDGYDSPEDIVRIAIEKGIDCLAITDHNEIKGAIKAMRFAFDKNILIVPGIEVTTKFGHILGINVKKSIPKFISPEKAIQEIRRQGGLAFIAHPFDWPVENFIGGEKKIKELASVFPGLGVEAFNSAVIFPYSNRKAYYFAKDNGLVFVAGSDAHRKEFVGRGYLQFKEGIGSINALIDAIKNKKGEPVGKTLNWGEIFNMIGKKGFNSLLPTDNYRIKFYLEKLRNIW